MKENDRGLSTLENPESSHLFYSLFRLSSFFLWRMKLSIEINEERKLEGTERRRGLKKRCRIESHRVIGVVENFLQKIKSLLRVKALRMAFSII